MRDRIEALFKAWGHFAYRRAWLVIPVMLALSGVVLTQASKIRIDTSTEGFFHENDPIRIAYDEFREKFGRDTLVLLAIEPPEVFDLEFLRKLRSLHEDLENQVPYVVEVRSLINARETRGDEDQLIVGDLMEDFPTTDAEVQDLKRRVFGNPLLIDNLVSADSTLTMIIIETEVYAVDPDADELGGFEDVPADTTEATVVPRYASGEQDHEVMLAVIAVVDRHRADDFLIYLTGTPSIIEGMRTSMQSDMRKFTGMAVGMIALLLGLLFRRVAGVVLPIFVVGLSVACSLSFMAWAGTPLTLPTQTLPTFLLAVGIGASVHILAIFYQARRRGEDKEAAIVFALGHSGLAVMMTSITTAGGLMSFAAAELRPIAHYGTYGPIGVMVGLVFTIILLPALIAVFPMQAGNKSAEDDFFSQRILIAVGEFATTHTRSVIAVWTILVVAGLAGASRITFSHDVLRWFNPNSEVRQATELVNERMRGSATIEALIDTHQENGLHDPELLAAIGEFQRRSLDLEAGAVFAGKSISLVDIVKEINQALNENRPEYYRVPEDRLLVAQELLLFENSGSDDLQDVVDSQFSVGRITIRFPFEDAVQYPPFFAQLEALAAETIGSKASFELTGMGVIIGYTLSAVIHTMVQSYAMALMVITPLIVLLIGNLRIGLFAMLPNLAPIIIILGIMGVFKIPMDAFTLLIGSIAIGLAVDDTIHFMHNFRRYYEETGDPKESVRRTLASTGQALLFTSLVLSGGFFIYMFASMTNLFYFGLLTGITIIIAFLADVILAPALMVLIARPQPVQAGATLEMEASG